MEKLTYDEAREWFWTRTWFWSLLVALLSIAAFFVYSSDIMKAVPARIWVSLPAGVGATLIAILAALISLQMPWMRRGWRRGFVLNAPFCAVVAGIAALLLSGIALSFLQGEPPDMQYHRQAYEAYMNAIDIAYKMMAFSIGVAAFWGFVYGAWFSLRRDKYFVEQI